MSVAFIYDPIYLKHDTGRFHPESVQRLISILHHCDYLKKRLLHLAPAKASKEILQLVHSKEHINRVIQACEDQMPLDPDTQVSADSFDAACMAAGAGISAVNAFVENRCSLAFAAVRPPGHHATLTHSMGFCLFNSIAVTARYAQGQGFKRVAIIDFDVHHGNGTQEIFYDDETVLYFSTHQYPAYPGSGSSDEQGFGKGEGYTKNFPLPAGSGDETVLPIYEKLLPPILEDFKPDLILVSAGYDLHQADPLAQLQVTTEGIGKIVTAILHSFNVPKLFMLEGGYDLTALGESVALSLEKMLAYE